MPDITMCRDSECPKQTSCYRALAKPSFRQSYFADSPRVHKEECSYYWPTVVDHFCTPESEQALKDLMNKSDKL